MRIQAGQNIKYISNQVGYANVKIALEADNHLTEDEEAMKAIRKAKRLRSRVNRIEIFQRTQGFHLAMFIRRSIQTSELIKASYNKHLSCAAVH